MKSINFLRYFSILSYTLIILAGQMIGIPFIGWLLFTTFDFGNTEQSFAVLGLLGIALNFTKWRNKDLITILSFLLILSPLFSRMIQIPLAMFNYAAFKVPLFIFITGYLVFIVLNARNRKSQVL
ncbi:hypothetical protein [Chryseobacterium sp. c4a]|uniref:hypothetical protein n=1 Tax=Chryseobacterium sp. c4a TaxID=1573582 RepID=UPI00135AD0AC|nr:hypothetical protein [Chryseobacterium sp. c4a]